MHSNITLAHKSRHRHAATTNERGDLYFHYHVSLREVMLIKRFIRLSETIKVWGCVYTEIVRHCRIYLRKMSDTMKKRDEGNRRKTIPYDLLLIYVMLYASTTFLNCGF